MREFGTVITGLLLGLVLIVATQHFVGDVLAGDDAAPERGDPAEFLPYASTSTSSTVRVLPGSTTEANDMGDPTFVPRDKSRATTTTAAPAPGPGQRWEVSSTMYSPCSAGDTTASGDPVREGIVAVNSSRFAELVNTRWRVVEGDARILGRTFIVRDHGPGADFDVWERSCAVAADYGRHRAVVVPA